MKPALTTDPVSRMLSHGLVSHSCSYRPVQLCGPGSLCRRILSSVLLATIVLSISGCYPYTVTHRKRTPISEETRIANTAETSRTPELMITGQPTIQSPQHPLTLTYSIRAQGPEETVTRFAERKYLYIWSPLHIPGGLVIALFFLFQDPPNNSEIPDKNARDDVVEWGCPSGRDLINDFLLGIVPCHNNRNVSLDGGYYKDYPPAEDIRLTGRIAEAHLPVARQPIQVVVLARGNGWEHKKLFSVLTNNEGQQTIPLDELFMTFPAAPQAVRITLTADNAQAELQLDSALCSVIYAQVAKPKGTT